MAFVILVLGSCRDSVCIEDIQDPESQINLVDNSNKVGDGLIAKLQAYNDSLSNQTESVNSSNSSILSKKWVKVAIEDCFGFCEGAAIGMTLGAPGGPETSAAGGLILGTLFGAYRSWKASSVSISPNTSAYDNCVTSYVKMKEEVSDYSEYYPKIISLQIPAEKQKLKIGGAQHNLVLDNIRKKNLSTTTLKDAYDNGIITKEEYNVLYNPNTQRLFHKMETSINRPSLPSGRITHDVVRLYGKAIENSSNSYDDVENISNRYLSEVFSSVELESAQKDTITSSICVMVSSVEYWKAFDAR